MKDFKDFGIKIRRDPERNYWSWWYDLKTIRLDLGKTLELEPGRSEFYDVSLGTKCQTGNCPFCYVNASKSGEYYKDICKTWKSWIDSFPEDKILTREDDEILKELLERPRDSDSNNIKLMKLISHINSGNIRLTSKPTQIAIGSESEPTEHPDFPEFLKTVYETGIVPNYTTNGVILSNYNKAKDILEATSKYCGGVAVSFSNKNLRSYSRKAVENLLKYGECKVMIHHIISDKESVNDFIKIANEYRGKIHYHVLLPLMPNGRSNKEMFNEVYPYLAYETKRNKIDNIALGANFKKYMIKYPGLFDTWELPEESYSKNVLLKNGKVIITPSSFNLNPIEEYDFKN